MSMTSIIPKKRGRPILQAELKNLSTIRRRGLRDLQDMMFLVPSTNKKLGLSVVNAYKDGLIFNKKQAEEYLRNLSKKGTVVDRTRNIIQAMQKPITNQKLKLYSVSGRVRVREFLPKKIVNQVAIEPYYYGYEVGARTDKEHQDNFGIPIIHNMTREVEAISPQDAIEKYKPLTAPPVVNAR